MSALKDKMQAMMNQVQTAVQTDGQSGGNDYFKLTVDNNQNGSAVLRFLPQPDLNELPYVQIYNHYFQDDVTGKVYREMSNSTWGEQDIVSQFNQWLWKQGYEDRGRKQKRNKQYFANVLVVKDPGKPENEGKVMVYRFGQKIFDKLKEAMTPDSSIGEEPINPFDPFDGANFRLKAKEVGGFRNYDSSSFDGKKSPIGDEEKIEKILEEAKDLTELVDPTKHKKSDAEQVKLLNEVFGREPLWMEFKEKAGLEDTPSASTPAPKAQGSQSSQSVNDQDDDDLPESMGGSSGKADEPKKSDQKKKDSGGDDVDDILASLGV